jgi:hypothetical protein
MTTSSTSLLGLALPATGELAGEWGVTVNDSITKLLDSAVAGTTTLSADNNVELDALNLAANQARQAILLCTGARTVLRTITAPARSKTYIVINATTGGFGVKVVGAGPTTGVTIGNGKKALIAWDGSDFVVVASTVINLASDVTGILAIANGGTGTSNAPNFYSVIVGNSNGTGYDSIPNGATRYVLKGRSNNTPEWGFVDLTTNVSGILPTANGGTGVNNSNTITLGGNISTAGALTTAGAFTTSGASGLTLTTTGTTNVTLPTSGTLVNTAVATLSSLTSVGTINNGTWQGTTIDPAWGGTGLNNGAYTIQVVNASQVLNQSVAIGASPVFGVVVANTRVSVTNGGELLIYTAGNTGFTRLTNDGSALVTNSSVAVTGYVTATTQPSFTASLSATQSNVIGFSSAPYLVPFDVTRFSRGGGYSGGSSFTAPVTGVYRFSISLRLSVAGATQVQGQLLVGANIYNFGTAQSASFAGTQTVFGSVLIEMTAGDVLYVSVNAQGMGGTTGAVVGGGLNTYFSGELVC